MAPPSKTNPFLVIFSVGKKSSAKVRLFSFSYTIFSFVSMLFYVYFAMHKFQ